MNVQVVLDDEGLIIERARTLKGLFAIESLPYKPLDKRLRKRRRKYFNDVARDNFLKWLALKHPEKLKQIDFDDYEIAQVAAYGSNAFYEKHGLHESQLNVDHIKSLFLEGTSHTFNLCVIPRWINRLKNDLELLQIEKNPNRTSLKTLVPIKENGKYNPIPKIPKSLWALPF